MIIRFGPCWLGFALGNLLYVLGRAFIKGNQTDIQWGRVLVAALLQGLIAAALFVVVQSVVSRKKCCPVRIQPW